MFHRFQFKKRIAVNSDSVKAVLPIISSFFPIVTLADFLNPQD